MPNRKLDAGKQLEVCVEHFLKEGVVPTPKQVQVFLDEEFSTPLEYEAARNVQRRLRRRLVNKVAVSSVQPDSKPNGVQRYSANYGVASG